jgi:hypothetical protein
MCLKHKRSLDLAARTSTAETEQRTHCNAQTQNMNLAAGTTQQDTSGERTQCGLINAATTCSTDWKHQETLACWTLTAPM